MNFDSTRRVLAGLLSVIFVSLTFVLLTNSGHGQTEDSVETIKTDQQKLAERYKQLETKLLSLHEFEKGSNPSRSKLLQKAFLQSQEKMTNVQLSRAAKLINDGKFKDAERLQGEALVNLIEMLKLLQAEDRAQQIRDDIDRFKEYAQEVDRLLRIQRGIRGQNEAGIDPERLEQAEESAAKRTSDLANQIKSDNQAQSGSQDDSNGESSEGSESNEGQPSEGQPSEGQPSEGQPSEGQPSEGSEGSSPQDQEPPQESDSIQDRINAAQQRMQDASDALKDAKRDNATKAMEEAEKELEEAKKELEEILRQLREEEVDSELKLLEERFRSMLEQQLRVNESTDKLALTPKEARTTEFEISANRLAGDQKIIATAAGRALLLLKEDGTSIAFPVTVEELQQDMAQVATRLSAAKVNEITQQIEADIVETLNELIEALVQRQEEMEEQEQQEQEQQGESAEPGDAPLVDQIAELKMLKSLQQRIYKRHQRYSKYLDDPNDPIGVSQEPDIIAALDRLADRQAQLTEITRQLVNEENK